MYECVQEKENNFFVNSTCNCYTHTQKHKNRNKQKTGVNFVGLSIFI